jgi:hypothetical protein
VKNMPFNRLDHNEYRIRGIIYDQRDLNKLAKFPSEKLNHFSAKATMLYILRKLGHDVICEFEIVGAGYGDLLDLTTNTQYEFETRNNPKYLRERLNQYVRKGVEVIIINVNKLPSDFSERYKALKEYVIRT